MPRINDTILDCVVYLYRSRDAAASGVAAGGSGFLLKIDTTRVPHSHFNVVVTNRHVGEKGHVVRLNTKEGKTEIVEVSKDRVFMSDKDDLAVILMPTIPEAYQINSIPRGCLVTEEFIQQHGIGIGDEVLMLGRFINRQGTQRNAPTARFGHISQMMGDPIKCDVDGNEVEQDDAILAEIKSIGGYSGSPVFVLPNRTYVRPGEPLPTDRGILLGVDFCHIKNVVSAQNEDGSRLNHIRFSENTGMAGVIPAWKIEELLNSDNVKKKLEEIETAFLSSGACVGEG